MSAVVHMDEKTPHLHLTFVPLTKDNRLCAKEIIGNRANLTKWQDDFHASMVEKYPDLERGESASKTGRKHMTLDALIEYDFDEAQAQEMIDSVSEAAQEKIDWNRVWSKKYPVLSTYHKTVRVEDYAPALGEMLTQLQVDYGYSHTDAVLVLKDILARVWKGQL